MRRKGKDDGITESDMDVTVSAHNGELICIFSIHACAAAWLTHACCAAMNEMTWRHVLAWEQMHCAECKSPQLLRFCGRPDELRWL